MSTPASPKVFISYRRQDTAGHAGRLYDAMAARFGEEHVFVDVDLEPGVDFVERIKEAIAVSHVLLVIIGPRWTVISDGDSDLPRLADPDDFVRLEVETALRRDDITVIPVLVAGAQMPDPDDLPEGLRALAHRNAIELSDMRWRYDVGRLNATLDERLAGTTAVHALPADEPAPKPTKHVSSTARLFIDGMLVAGLAALVARVLAEPIDPMDVASDEGQVAIATLRRAVVWAVLGLALAVWLSFVRDVRPIAPRALTGLAIGALAGALGGVIQFAPTYLPDLDARDSIDAISILAFAISGGLIGGLLGALWTPRRLAVGLGAGLVSGALVRLFWNAMDWQPDTTFEESVGVGLQCLLIVGLVLATLQLLSTQRSPALGSAGVGPQGAR